MCLVGFCTVILTSVASRPSATYFSRKSTGDQVSLTNVATPPPLLFLNYHLNIIYSGIFKELLVTISSIFVSVMATMSYFGMNSATSSHFDLRPFIFQVASHMAFFEEPFLCVRTVPAVLLTFGDLFILPD